MKLKYTHNEFLLEKAANKIQFSVNQNVNKAEVENLLPPTYKQSQVASNGVSILLLVLALPLYLVFGWIVAVLAVFGALGMFLYFQRFNYRVLVRANVKTDPVFYEYCVKNNVISIYEINRG